MRSKADVLSPALRWLIKVDMHLKAFTPRRTMIKAGSEKHVNVEEGTYVSAQTTVNPLVLGHTPLRSHLFAWRIQHIFCSQN